MIYSDLYILLLLIYKQEFILLQGIMLTDMRLLVLNYPKYIGFCYLCLAISPYRHHQSKAFWTILIAISTKIEDQHYQCIQNFILKNCNLISSHVLLMSLVPHAQAGLDVCTRNTYGILKLISSVSNRLQLIHQIIALHLFVKVKCGKLCFKEGELKSEKF